MQLFAHSCRRAQLRALKSLDQLLLTASPRYTICAAVHYDWQSSPEDTQIVGTSRIARPRRGLWLLSWLATASLVAVGCRAAGVPAHDPPTGTAGPAADAATPSDSAPKLDADVPVKVPPTAAGNGSASSSDAGANAAADHPITQPGPTPVVTAPSVRDIPTVAAPQVLGTLAGPDAVLSPDGASMYGTDLGYSFEHKGQLFMLFGDTWPKSDSICTVASTPTNDDSLASLPLAYGGGVPALAFLPAADAPSQPSTLHLMRGSTSLNLGYGQAPVAGFSDGERAYALFARLEPLHCDADWTTSTEACPTDDHFFCSTELGTCKPDFTSFPWVCDVARQQGCLPTQECVAAPLCVDSNSSQSSDGQTGGQMGAVTFSTEFGVQREAEPGVFDSRFAWPTSKFSQPSVRTVTQFTGFSTGNDYRPGYGSLLVWGRPGFIAEHGREAQLYLMVHPLPMQFDDQGALRFTPRYFAGIDTASAEPIWSDKQSDAKPLALDGRIGGDPHEELNLVGLGAVSWLGDPINKWVMLYGGDFADYLVLDPPIARAPRAPGAIMIRFADQPWGPFSPPVPHLQPGSPMHTGDPYGPGGFLYHPDCVSTQTAQCAASDPVRPLDTLISGCPFSTIDPGRLYAPNIIDSYTKPNADGGIDLLWNVSTWNPYAVKLFKTRIQAPNHAAPTEELADAAALERLSDWRDLAVLGEPRRFVQQSSRDRTTDDNTWPLSGHGNRDFNNFVCASKDTKQAADQITPFHFDLPECQEAYVRGAVIGRFEGSGQLVRTWIGMASLLSGPADEEILRIYVDDEPKPRVEVPLADALSGKAGEIFAPPFGAASTKRMAWYYPTAFHHKLIVSIDNLGAYDEYYYHCDVEFDAATATDLTDPLPVSRLAERDAAIDQLTNVFHPAGPTTTLQSVHKVQLAAGATEHELLAGPATIQELSVRVAAADLAALADVNVMVRWDAVQQPAIDMPLLQLFGGGRTVPDRSSLAISSFAEFGEQVLVLKLPMPFASLATWSFHNTGTAPIAFSLLIMGTTDVPDPRSGHLHVQQVETNGSGAALEYMAAAASGRGRLAGACIYVEGHSDLTAGIQTNPMNLLEGDVRVKLDGVLAVDGTGTEEYADDVFYFTDAPHANAFSQAWGMVSDTLTTRGQASLCHWHVLGTELDFRSSLEMTIELGGAANPSLVELHRTTAYLYLAD